jgi:hypothetical protein
MMKLKIAVSALVILSLLCACTPRDTPQTDPSLPPSQTETQCPESTSAPELKVPAKEETIPAREEETDASETAPSQPPKQNQEETTPAETKPKENTPPETKPIPTEPPQTEPPQTEPPQTEPPQTEPPQTEPPVTEPPQTEPSETVKPDTAAIEAYGRAYASSLGFVIDTSLGKGNSGYYSPDYRPLCSTEEGFSVAAGMVAATKNQLNSRFSNEYCEVLVEEAYGIARCNVVVVYSHTDELGDWYYTYVLYG